MKYGAVVWQRVAEQGKTAAGSEIYGSLMGLGGRRPTQRAVDRAHQDVG